MACVRGGAVGLQVCTNPTTTGAKRGPPGKAEDGKVEEEDLPHPLAAPSNAGQLQGNQQQEQVIPTEERAPSTATGPKGQVDPAAAPKESPK